MEIRVGVMRWRILKETQWKVNQRVIFTVCTIISKSTGRDINIYAKEFEKLSKYKDL